MKKIIAIIAVIVTAVFGMGVFSGCGAFGQSNGYTTQKAAKNPDAHGTSIEGMRIFHRDFGRG